MGALRTLRFLALALASLTSAAQDLDPVDAFGDTQVILSTAESGVEVYVDDVFQGRTGGNGQRTLRLPQGMHSLRLQKDGFEPTRRELLVGPVTELVTVGLTRELPPTPWLLYLLIGLLVACGALALALAVSVRQKRTSLRFDRYRVLRPIGRGGMATVFLARDARTQVALKVMDPALLNDHDLVRKFLKEGEVLQMIQAFAPMSPVVRAHRFGRENGLDSGRPFVALEYVPGDTLLKFFRDHGALPVRQVLGIARQVCQGLAAAHAQGIWHRDISPDNVLLAETPRADAVPTVKLIDFGVAKHEYTQAKTLDGSISGKPAYMSPEQCSGTALDGRSDLYSVGIMMYTMLSGAAPFTDPNPLLVMRLHETAPVPPLPASIPAPVRDLVGRLLAKDPAARPHTATEVVAELSALERTN